MTLCGLLVDVKVSRVVRYRGMAWTVSKKDVNCPSPDPVSPPPRPSSILTAVLPQRPQLPVPSPVPGLPTAGRQGILLDVRSRQGQPAEGAACTGVPCHLGGKSQGHPSGGDAAAGGGAKAAGSTTMCTSLHIQRTKLPLRNGPACGVPRTGSVVPVLPSRRTVAPVEGSRAPGGGGATEGLPSTPATVVAVSADRPRNSSGTIHEAALSD